MSASARPLGASGEGLWGPGEQVRVSGSSPGGRGSLPPEIEPNPELSLMLRVLYLKGVPGSDAFDRILPPAHPASNPCAHLQK